MGFTSRGRSLQISKSIFLPSKNCFSGLLGVQNAIHWNMLLDWVSEFFTNTAAQATLQGCRDEVQVLHQAAKIILRKSKDRWRWKFSRPSWRFLLEGNIRFMNNAIDETYSKFHMRLKKVGSLTRFRQRKNQND